MLIRLASSNDSDGVAVVVVVMHVVIEVIIEPGQEYPTGSPRLARSLLTT
jgi:hypothetical protein